MKAVVVLVGLAISWSALGESPGQQNWSQVVDSGDGKYSLTYNPDASRFEVLNLDGKAPLPKMVKLSVHRKNAPPLELKLETVTAPSEPIRYLGQFRQWDASVTGVQMEMSFDKKTWKSVGRFFRVSPR